MKHFFEWGFKTLICGAATLLVYYMQDISKTINAMDIKFGVAITKLQEQAGFVQAAVQDHEARLRIIEHKKENLTE
jgi:hypothetical protein